jgi:uncharacterized membrane protein
MSLAVPSAAAGSDGGTADSVTVRLEPTSSSLKLGENLNLHVTVTNSGTQTTPPLVVHIDVTDPSQATSVDPEDWTSTLSQRLGSVAPGTAATVEWNVQPISGGTFLSYAVALSPGSDTIATSNAVRIDVARQRTLNPGGILAVAVGVPVVIAMLLLLQIARSRRRRDGTTASAP